MYNYYDHLQQLSLLQYYTTQLLWAVGRGGGEEMWTDITFIFHTILTRK